MIYELRQYTVAAGRMEECQVLFQDVIDPLFREVGIRPVGYWQPTERDGQTFVYLLAFESAPPGKDLAPIMNIPLAGKLNPVFQTVYHLTKK
ncbi:MAG: hypothetical protein CM1200mP18_22060 [Gammaproteobacteria bacterium]|nr:MAG: hypothetical protein CM1200mP18_22060 [Gammaproteobacteria bacterium]